MYEIVRLLKVRFIDTNFNMPIFQQKSATRWLFILCLLPSFVLAQAATVRGIVFETEQNVLPNVSVQILNADQGTASDINGAYLLEIPARKEVSIRFSFIGMKNLQVTMELESNEDYEFNPVLKI